MATYTGTNHFVSKKKALEYYKPYIEKEDLRELVDFMIDKGEINIGLPKLKENETYYINNEGRYIIESIQK